MGWFQFGRDDGYPTHYSDQHSPAHVDILTSGFILAFIILAVCLFILLPAYNGNKRWIFFTQIIISLCIGGIVLVGNFGGQWEVGTVEITSAYKAGSAAEIRGKLGLAVALRGVNITLKGEHKSKELSNEHIDYNEHFSWEWSQGRFGFGYYAGRFNRDYRRAVYRGLPIPILQLAEYFTFDGEGIRFGRHYKTAGYYAHIMMWLAFPTWLISNILFCVVVRYATTFLISTGLFQLIAIIIWTFVRNPIELKVPFEHYKEEVILSTTFGPDYYLVFLNAIICLVFGFGIFILDMFIPDELCTFFGIDPLTIYDEYHLSKEEIDDERRRKTMAIKNTPTEGDTHLRNNVRSKVSLMEQGEVNNAECDSSGTPMTDDIDFDTNQSRLVLKRRTIVASKLFQKSLMLKEKPRVKPRIKHTKVSNEYELANVRTPLLQVSNSAGEYGSSAEEEPVISADYANFPATKSQDSSGVALSQQKAGPSVPIRRR